MFHRRPQRRSRKRTAAAASAPTVWSSTARTSSSRRISSGTFAGRIQAGTGTVPHSCGFHTPTPLGKRSPTGNATPKRNLGGGQAQRAKFTFTGSGDLRASGQQGGPFWSRGRAIPSPYGTWASPPLEWPGLPFSNRNRWSFCRASSYTSTRNPIKAATRSRPRFTSASETAILPGPYIAGIAPTLTPKTPPTFTLPTGRRTAAT